VSSPHHDPQAEEELRLAARFLDSLHAGNIPAAVTQLTALHDLRELAAEHAEPEAEL
jgi:hypothetical protein